MGIGPHTQHLHGLDFWEDVGEIKLSRIACMSKISDLDFADDAVNLAETLDVLIGALEALNEESFVAAGTTGFLGQNKDPGFQ